MNDEREKLLESRRTLKIRTIPSNYFLANLHWLITCLPIGWKILTTQIIEEIFYSLVFREQILKEQMTNYSYNRKSSKKPKQGGKGGHGIGWQQKSLWYGSPNLDNRVSENVQNIRQNHKWKSKNPKRYLSGRLTLRTAIRYSNDTTQLHRKCVGLQIYKITRKD